MDLLGGVDLRRGRGAVKLGDGHQMELRTMSVETRHVLELEEHELPAESCGQLHEGDFYIIRWTYTLHPQGGCLWLSISYSSVQQSRSLMFLCTAETAQSPEDDSRGVDGSSAVFLWRGRRSHASGPGAAALQSSNQEDSQVRLQTAAVKHLHKTRTKTQTFKEMIGKL